MSGHLVAWDFFELSNNMFCIAGPDGFFKDANPAFCSALGYTRHELLSFPIISFLHPDDVQPTAELLDLTSCSLVIENRYRCADGAFKWFSWKYSIVSDRGLILGAAQEIDSPGQAKRDLDIQKLYLTLEQKILEQLSGPSRQLKNIIDYYLKELNDLYPNMGYAVQLVKGNRLFLLSSSSLPESYVAYFENGVIIENTLIYKTETSYFKSETVYDNNCVHPYFHSFRDDLIKHHLFSCRMIPVINVKKEVIAAFVAYYKNNEPGEAETQHVRRIGAFLKIILEVFRTKENLNWSAERYKFVTLASKDAIYDWDITNDRTYWGEGFERFFGYNEEVTDISWWKSRIHPEDVDDIDNSLAEIIETSVVNNWNAEYRFRRADNTYAYISEDGFIIRDSSGKAIRMVGAMHDHTKVYEQQYQVLKQNNRLREIAQINSHYIRKPLANVLGLISVIQAADNSELKGLLSLLEISGTELDQIVREIAKKTYF